MSEEGVVSVAIYGCTIRIPLEQVTLWRVRLASEAAKAELEALGVTPGPLHSRCEQSRWVELDSERFFMPAEVIYYREGMKL